MRTQLGCWRSAGLLHSDCKQTARPMNARSLHRLAATGAGAVGGGAVGLGADGVGAAVPADFSALARERSAWALSVGALAGRAAAFGAACAGVCAALACGAASAALLAATGAVFNAADAAAAAVSTAAEPEISGGVVDAGCGLADYVEVEPAQRHEQVYADQLFERDGGGTGEGGH